MEKQKKTDWQKHVEESQEKWRNTPPEEKARLQLRESIDSIAGDAEEAGSDLSKFWESWEAGDRGKPLNAKFTELLFTIQGLTGLLEQAEEDLETLRKTTNAEQDPNIG